MAIQDLLPKSRLTLKYRTDITGIPQDIELPFRVLVIGNFSGKNSKKIPLDERRPISFKGASADGALKDLRIKVSVTDSDGDIHKIPIKDMRSFQPASICKSVDKIDSLMKAKELMSYLQSSVNNSSKFRMALKNMIENPEALAALKQVMEPTYQKATTLPLELLNEQE